VNTIRKAMPEHVEALREPLFAAYRRIARYQFERTDESEMAMRRTIGVVVPLLRPFRKLLPRYKQTYLRVLEDAAADAALLPASDLLMLFDETVFLLHIRLSPRERGEAPTLEPWGAALLALLDERRTFAGPI
jgi:hypothetical protein